MSSQAFITFSQLIFSFLGILQLSIYVMIDFSIKTLVYSAKSRKNQFFKFNLYLPVFIQDMIIFSFNISIILFRIFSS